MEAAKQCIRYLFATKNYGITYSKHLSGAPHVFMKASPGGGTEADEKASSFEMVTYADADLGGDEITLKSTTGFCIMLNGGVVSWSSNSNQWWRCRRPKPRRMLQWRQSRR